MLARVAAQPRPGGDDRVALVVHETGDVEILMITITGLA
jgi:hypothetical protein